MEIMTLIKDKRIRLGLTQKEFADALGFGKNGDRTLRRWEHGESTPSPLEIKLLLSFPENPPFHYNIDLGNENFRFIDLFAGIGGIRLAFQAFNGRCVFTSEWDKFSQKSYLANFGETPAGDITKIPSADIPDHDILLAGFPCQPFSQAGLKKGFSDTRGTLFFDIERIIGAKRPAAFLLENVKQLRGHDKGHTLKVIIQHLKNLNYTVDTAVLRAADFGLPQNRERLFIVGFNKDLIPEADSFVFSFPTPPRTETKVGSILQKEVDNKYTLSNALYQGHLRRKEEHQKKGNGFGFSLFTPDSPYTSTLSARYYKDGSEILISQSTGHNPRKLTPRECARLQGFPENFVISVSDTQAYRQFGNSVAVPVVRAVAENMVNTLISLGVIHNN